MCLKVVETCPCVIYNWVITVNPPPKKKPKNYMLSLRFVDGWYCQSITKKKIFLNIYEQRLIDCFQQECDALLFLHHPQNGLNSAI